MESNTVQPTTVREWLEMLESGCSYRNCCYLGMAKRRRLAP